MLPAAVRADEVHRDALNRVRARKALRSEQTSPRHVSTRATQARVTS